jgi:hypothetical protein
LSDRTCLDTDEHRILGVCGCDTLFLHTFSHTRTHTHTHTQSCFSPPTLSECSKTLPTSTPVIVPKACLEEDAIGLVGHGGLFDMQARMIPLATVQRSVDSTYQGSEIDDRMPEVEGEEGIYSCSGVRVSGVRRVCSCRSR